MLWTFAVIFTVLWALSMRLTNNMGPGVHVLLIIGAIFVALAVWQHRKLARQQGHSHPPE
jgi:F0F1-type ATP synthase membrane subunit a